VLGLSLAYFTILTAPGLTWINTDSDGATYLTSAKYFRLSHPTGAPLYNLINMAAVRIPLGEEAWRLAIMSAIAASLTSALLYLITKNLLAPLVFLASGLVVSQSTIIETYSLVTLLSVLGYYLHTSDSKYKYLALGLGLAVHHLAIFVLVPIMVHDYFNNKSLKFSLLVLPPLLFYFYVPIFNREPFRWILGDGFSDYFRYFTSQGGLIGGLAIIPIGDLIERIQDFSVVVLGGFTFSIVVLLFGIIRSIQKKNYLLPALIILPLAYYASDLAPQTYVYTLPAFAFGAILIAKTPIETFYKGAIVVTSLILIGLNIQLYDIGRTLDSELSASKYYNDLSSIPNDSTIWVDSNGWEATTAWMYNLDNGLSSIKVVSRGFSGISLPDIVLLLEAQKDSNLYRTVSIDHTTYLVEIVKWNSSRAEILS
ncbi:hypothetical protein LCGC14_2742570, partial [marine sediment metagenome]